LDQKSAELVNPICQHDPRLSQLLFPLIPLKFQMADVSGISGSLHMLTHSRRRGQI
jgi:hypothetical protein